MKQHITVEQLSEISNEQIEKIKDSVVLHARIEIVKRHFTIGRMIEILECKYMVSINNLFERKYSVKLIKSDTHFYTTFESDRCKELCDALWDAVKYVMDDDYE